MKKYTITDQEWESVLDKVHTLEKENSHLKGVIDGLEKQLQLCGVGCSKISNEQKQKAYDSAIKLVNEIFDW